jgi:plastocyanin
VRISADRPLLALAAVAAVLVAGCSSSPAPAGPSSGASRPAATDGATGGAGVAARGGKVTIKTSDRLMFSPSVITTGVGTLTVTLSNTGSYPHNLAVPALHVTSHTVSGDPGSASTTVTLHFTKPGRYPFVCTYHASAGMRGAFIVK